MPVPAPCYLRGTRIRTPEGERRIEELNIGDEVISLSGESKPIKWIGRRRFKKTTEFWPTDFEPIRISCFALDKRTPHRELYISPSHAIYIDGVLIPAIYLVNGRSIPQCAPEGADSIEYLHIELFAHDVIYAEGARAETFFAAAGVRDRFENFAEYQRRTRTRTKACILSARLVCMDSPGASTGPSGPYAAYWSRGSIC